MTLIVFVGCPFSIVDIIVVDLLSNYFATDVPS